MSAEATPAGLKHRLRGNQVLGGYMCTIPSAVAVQAIAAAGADWVLIDQEHGAVGREAMHAMIAATAGTPCAPLVRVPACDEAWVKPALDLGAAGICFPMVNTAEDAARCVAMLRYPPHGRRGWGPFIAHSRWQVALGEYLPRLGPESVSILSIETRSAVENIEAICQVPGIDCLVVAPFDLSTDLGCPGDFQAPEFRAATLRAETAILAAGIPLGGVALDQARARELAGRGYRLLAHGFDVLVLAGHVRAAASWRGNS